MVILQEFQVQVVAMEGIDLGEMQAKSFEKNRRTDFVFVGIEGRKSEDHRHQPSTATGCRCPQKGDQAMRDHICTLCLLLLFATAWGQTAEIVLKNGIKTNLLGPVMVIRAGTLQFFWWNADLRYERKMPNIQYLSIVGEVMFSKRQDVFSVYNPNGNWMDFAVSHQMDLNLLAGPRLTRA